MSSQIAPRNPFRPGMGLEPPYLADRSKHLERFARFLEGFPDLPRNVRLTGLRGLGKTVLLQHYSNAAGERDWLVVRREWSEHLQDERMLALADREGLLDRVDDQVCRGDQLRGQFLLADGVGTHRADVGAGANPVLHHDRGRIGAEIVSCRGYHIVLASKNAECSPSFLTLDLSADCELDGVPFYAGAEILATRRRYREFWIPAADLEFGCYLVRTIAKASLDDERRRA